MFIDVDVKQLRAFLESDEDCEALSINEYVADLYDGEKPLTLTIAFGDKGAEIIAAAYLLYDSELDGWYMGERTEDSEEILSALRAAINREK